MVDIDQQPKGDSMTTSTEVKLGANIYDFASAAEAQGFRTCLASGTLDDCKKQFPASNVRTVEETDAEQGGQ
jgi:hypothetical protein